MLEMVLGATIMLIGVLVGAAMSTAISTVLTRNREEL